MNPQWILNLLVLWTPKGWSTVIALIAFGLLTTVFGVDLKLHDKPDTEAFETAWLALSTYGMLFGAVVTYGGAGFRRAMDAANQANPPTN